MPLFHLGKSIKFYLFLHACFVLIDFDKVILGFGFGSIVLIVKAIDLFSFKIFKITFRCVVGTQY